GRGIGESDEPRDATEEGWGRSRRHSEGRSTVRPSSKMLRWRKADVGVLLLIAATSACTHAGRLQPADRQYGLAYYLKGSIGTSAVDCGSFRFPLAIKHELSPDQRASASACMNEARRNKQAFVFWAGGVVFDSFVASGLLMAPSGELKRFSYDNAPCGNPALW